MTQTKPEFWSKLSQRYARQAIADPAAYEATLQRTQTYLSSEDTVLELGAGTSSTALRLAPMVAQYISSDYSAGMTAIGRDKAFAASIPGLTVVEGALGNPALGTGPFDTILAFNLLHLLPDLESQLDRIAAHLRPGGLFISKSPCLKGRLGPISLVISVMQWIGKAPYLRKFSPDALEAMIAQAGFEVIESDSYPTGGRNQYIVARKL
ncbi:MAG: class I SAM-dependent methyltransferase [Pseudomonadota bacterium]